MLPIPNTPAAQEEKVEKTTKFKLSSIVHWTRSKMMNMLTLMLGQTLVIDKLLLIIYGVSLFMIILSVHYNWSLAWPLSFASVIGMLFVVTHPNDRPLLVLQFILITSLSFIAITYLTEELGYCYKTINKVNVHSTRGHTYITIKENTRCFSIMFKNYNSIANITNNTAEFIYHKNENKTNTIPNATVSSDNYDQFPMQIWNSELNDARRSDKRQASPDIKLSTSDEPFGAGDETKTKEPASGDKGRKRDTEIQGGQTHAKGVSANLRGDIWDDIWEDFLWN